MERMACRGVRGATTTGANEEELILTATRQLLQEMVTANDIAPTEIASAFFTTTPDLDAAYPARAARQLGWMEVPLMGACEIAPPEALARTIRVLLHWNTTKKQSEIRHVYSNGAEVLRPDLTQEE